MKMSSFVLGALLTLMPLGAYANSSGAGTATNNPPTPPAALSTATENATAKSETRPLRRAAEELKTRETERKTVRKNRETTVHKAKETAKSEAKSERHAISASRNKVSAAHRSGSHVRATSKSKETTRLKHKREKT